MNEVLLDTHALIWYLENSPRLTVVAKQAIAGAISRQNGIAISAITLAEILYLEEKGRLRQGTLATIQIELREPDTALEEIAFTGEIVESMRRISRDVIPDLPDRIIAASAIYLGIPLVTADRKIRAAAIPIIW